MKYLILFLLLLPLSLIGQVESQFNGTLNVFSGSRIGSTNTFTISGIFNSTTTSYTSSQSDTGDIVQVQSGARFYWLHVYSIASNSGGVITCNVRDSSSTLTTFPLGKWSVFRPTTNLRLPLSPDGETNASRSSTFNTLALRVDEIQTAVASATNCEQTFTKASHGFRKGTPVFWNGSTYIRPTADSLVPDFVVVDSLTANTFKVANCGTYTTALANGLYWFTSASPGYSLTADTTKVPLFQALNGKMILNPIVGFNLMSGGGAGDVTRDELADSTAAIRADFPNGIISALPLGNVNINANGNSLIFKKLRSLKLKTTTGKTAMSIDTFSNGLFFSLNKTVPGTNLGSLLYFRDTTGIKDNAFYFGQIDYSFSQNSGSGHQMIFGIGGDKVVGGDKSYFGVRNDTSGTIPIVRMMYGDRYSNPTTPDIHHFRGAVPNSALVSDAAFRIQTSSASGKLSVDIDNSLFIRENGKVYIGADSSFIHDPVQDSTFQKGTAVFGKASTLGSPTVMSMPFVFRNPGLSSTYLLIESGRDQSVGGEAVLNLRSSGGWSEGVQFYNDLSFYNYKNSRVNLKIGSNGAFLAGRRTVIAGYIDDPSQWNSSATLVVYDTITVGKALFVAKKVASSVTPIAVFSSASNDRMTIEDDGDVKIGTGAASAKLHVVGDCIIESTLWLNSAKTVGIFSGTGSPEGVVAASVGSTFHCTNGGALTSYYVKESGSGNTGWVPK